MYVLQHSHSRGGQKERGEINAVSLSPSAHRFLCLPFEKVKSIALLKCVLENLERKEEKKYCSQLYYPKTGDSMSANSLSLLINFYPYLILHYVLLLSLYK